MNGSIDWPDLLVDYRRRRGLKQEAAAQDFGVSQATISRWESGASLPPRAVQNRLFAAVRRERSPLDTLHWVETFKRLMIPGAVTSHVRKVDIVTGPMAKLLGVPPEALQGVDIADAFEGDVPELDAGVVKAGLFTGRLASFEAVGRLRISPHITRGVDHWMHYIGWPHFLDDGRIVSVSQGVAVGRREAAEVKARLGGALLVTTSG